MGIAAGCAPVSRFQTPGLTSSATGQRTLEIESSVEGSEMRRLAVIVISVLATLAVRHPDVAAANTGCGSIVLTRSEVREQLGPKHEAEQERVMGYDRNIYYPDISMNFLEKCLTNYPEVVYLK